MPTELPEELDRAVTQVRDAIAFVERRAINRTDVVKRIFCALLTREHVLLQARTGVGKSLLANQVFAMFDGARIFHVQASKEQQPDTYFGALDLEELKKGRIVHNTEGSLVESEFGFIDEIFDANDYTLRALLTCLNERKMVRGVQSMAAAIHTVIAATNYVRVTEVTEAVLDRFLYKAVIDPDREPFFMYRISQQFVMHRGQVAKPETRMPFSALKRISNVIRGHDPVVTVHVPPEYVFFANLVLRHYEALLRRARRQKESGGPDFYISPRTQAKALDAMRAVAVMNRRLTVTIDDVSKLKLMLCTAGVREEHEIWDRAFDSLRNHYAASQAFEQLHTLLELQDVIDRVRLEPALLAQPIAELASTKVRRTLAEWAKSKLGMEHDEARHNQKLLTAYLDAFEPLTDEIRLLKARLADEIVHLFKVDEPWS
ncbi:MAG: MoxR family ATPase [Planctomycetes bacterium]|nr:MoxR family ATPase [Planctomycetota bacterium]